MRYTVAITVRLEEDVLEELRARAAKEERSVGSLIRIAVREMLATLDKVNKGDTI